MPFLVTASDRSEKLWGNLLRWPVRLDSTILIVSLITLLFSLSSGVFHAGIEYDRWRHENFTPSELTSNIASRISLEIVVPLFAIGLAVTNVWLFTCRSLTPGIAVATTLVMLVAWATTFAFWVPEVMGHHSLSSIYGVRIMQLIGAALELILNLVYLTYSAIAVHRYRKYGPSSVTVESRMPSSGVELESRRVSIASLADHNSGLKVHDDFGRRRTSLTPSYDIGKGPRVEPKEMF